MDGIVHSVLVIVKILCSKSKTLLVELDGGLLVTPKHPVFWRGNWIKPLEIR